LADYEDFRYLVDKDICDMAEEFGKHTQRKGCIIFGLGRFKKLTGVMHWIQDCHCTNNVPGHNNFDEQVLAEVQSRALVRKSDINLVDTNTKAADPRKLAQMGESICQLFVSYSQSERCPIVLCCA
jgi:hypothetical protein